MIEEKKQCRKCKKFKALSEMKRRKSKPDGFSFDSICKECSAKADKAYYASDHGKLIRKKYQESEKGKASLKKYQESERRKAKLKKYQESEKGKAKTMAHRKAHYASGRMEKATNIWDPDKIKRESMKRAMYALRRGELVAPDNCQICRKPFDPDASKVKRPFIIHHDDYFLKRLKIRFLCFKCHGDRTLPGHKDDPNKQ